jgi:hypothetical protein
MSNRADTAAALERLIVRKGELARSAGAAPIARRLQELRTWQAARLARTYADLRVDPLAAGALTFFLTDLYGPRDLTRRDRDVARAWPLLKRALPPRMLEVLCAAIELDVLSAELDLQMARQMPDGPLTMQTYGQVYRAVGGADARRRQIGLIVEIGNALGRAVRSPLAGLALRAAHGPAHMAGLGVLQDFLERGYAAFRNLADPGKLLAVIEARETRLMRIWLSDGTMSLADAEAETKADTKADESGSR